MLSTRVRTPFAFPIRAIAARSASFSVGFVGVSTQISFVRGVIARSTRAASVMSTGVKARPCRVKTLSKMRNVPPYASSA